MPSTTNNTLGTSPVNVDSISLEREGWQLGKQAGPKAHHRISGGDVVRVLCRKGTEDNRLVDTLRSTERYQVTHVSALILVVYMATVSDETLSAVGIKLHRSTRNCEFRFQLSDSHVQVFKITNTFTKCASFHNCQRNKGCVINFQTKHIFHQLEYGKIAHVFALTGQSGYPCLSLIHI